MAGKRYSAGAIFLQVVPVFQDVQNAIERNAKEMDKTLGDEMEKSGEKAGKRAGKAAGKGMNEELAKASGSFEKEFRKNVDGINNALGEIDVEKLGNNLRKELTGIKKELDSLKKVDLTVDVEKKKADAAIAELEGRLAAFRDDVKIVFRSDVDNALKGFAKVRAAKEAIEDPIDIEVRVDAKDSYRELSHLDEKMKKTTQNAAKYLRGDLGKAVAGLKKDLEGLSEDVGISVNATQARAELRDLERELRHLANTSPDINVKVAAEKAHAEIFALNKDISYLDGREARIDVKVDKKGAATASRWLGKVAGDGDKAANSFRSFNAILLAAASLGPALIPVLAGIAGGLLAIAPAAAVAAFGLTSVIIGFTGIQDAVEALQAKEDQAAVTNQTASRQAVDNAERVADARRAAADAIEAALERQADAQERYRDSVQDVKDAEEALRQAREDARGTGDDIKDQIRDNALAQDQGLLDVFNATVAYNSTMADGSSTNAEQEQARINMEAAQNALHELREEGRELAKEQKRWREEGVNGTDDVKDAQERLNDSIEAQTDAYEDLRDAAEEVDEARTDGARNVQRALEDQAQALDDLSTQQNKVNEAFENLGPAGQKFARFIFGLKQGFYDLRDAIQAAMLPRIQSALQDFFKSPNARVLRGVMVSLADNFGRLVQALGRSFQGPAWTGFFTMLADIGPDIQDAYGRAFISFMEGLASVLTTLAPYALIFADAFAKMADSFAEWAQSKDGQKLIQDFMDYAVEVGPDVVEFVKGFAGAAANLAVGLAGWGDVVLDHVIDFLDFLADMDPKVLGAIVTAISVIITSSQTAYAAMNILMAGGALLTSSVGLIVFAIAGILIALGYLYKSNEDFKKFVDDAWKEISKAFTDAWEDIKPALAELWDSIEYLWKEVLQPFLEWFGPIFVAYIVIYIRVMARYFSYLARGLAFAINNIIVPGLKIFGRWLQWLWKNIFKPVVEQIATQAEWLWKNVLRPTFHAIGDGWDGLMRGMRWVWNHILAPVFAWIVNDALPGLEGAFQTAVDAIGVIWEGLQAVVGEPIKFVLDTLLNNGLIDGFNAVAGWVGLDGFDHIPIPRFLQSYAQGGVTPGYTPGRDVHKYVSPTGGRLELSGGEAIMRPEFTAAVGSGWVHAMNAAARTGGVNNIRKIMASMGGYFNGGVLPLPGASVRSHGNSYGHYAADMNFGSGYDDFGMAIKAWKDGIIAQMNYIGDASYGRWVVMNHGAESSLYAHMSKFGPIEVGQKVNAGQTIGYVGDLGNTGTPPTSHLHFEILGGSQAFADSSGDDGSGGGMRAIPKWLLKIVKDPLGAVKGWVTDPIKNAAAHITDSPIFDMVTKVPLLLAKKTADKVWDIVPGWVKTAAGWAGNAAEWVVGGVGNVADGVGNAAGAVADGAGAVKDFLGFKTGGILPYNGTMKYDAGGYLPPGLTSVVNLTGKPEPVFTADQMDGGLGGETYHYEPHFVGTDLTAGDVAGDMNAGFRRLKRSGKYGGNN